MGIKNISYELAEKVIEIGEAISLMTPDWDQFVIRKEDVKRLKAQKKEMDKEPGFEMLPGIVLGD